MRRLLPVLVATAAALAVSAQAHAAGACGSSPYAYAGLLDSSPRYGVGATISVLGTPTVRGGHVAAWVGVGGEGLGPNGTDEWLQAGVSDEPGGGLALYYELALPKQAPRYVPLGDRVTVGTRVQVAVVESRKHRGLWRVYVNGIARSAPIRLPGSHGAWRPVATSESWDGGIGACNSFAFGFSRLAVAAKPGGSWTPLHGNVLTSSSFRVARQGAGAFVATSAPLRSSRRTGCGTELAASCRGARGRGRVTSS